MTAYSNFFVSKVKIFSVDNHAQQQTTPRKNFYSQSAPESHQLIFSYHKGGYARIFY